MKNVLFLLLFSVVFSSFAEVKSIDNPSFSKKQKKSCKVAIRRAINFYSWYINYRIQNDSKPLKHVVIDQNASVHMRSEAANSMDEYDVFLASKEFDKKMNLEIQPEKVEANRISLKINVHGAINYSFHADMIIQKGYWCIDLVVPDEDLNPALVENE